MKISQIVNKGITPKISQVIGSRKGRLLIEFYAGYYDKRYYVGVLCDCGCKKIVNVSNIIWGNTVSCGCHNEEMKKKHK